MDNEKVPSLKIPKSPNNNPYEQVSTPKLQAAQKGQSPQKPNSHHSKASSSNKLPYYEDQKQSSQYDNQQQSSASQQQDQQEKSSDQDQDSNDNEILTRQLYSIYESFCRYGNRQEAAGQLDGPRFVKLCKDSNLINKQFTQVDTDIVFAKVKRKGQRKIDWEQFINALELIAQKKSIELEDVVYIILSSEGPVTKATRAQYVKFHDDKTLYTGVYARGGPTNYDQDPNTKFMNQLQKSLVISNSPSMNRHNSNDENQNNMNSSQDQDTFRSSQGRRSTMNQDRKSFDNFQNGHTSKSHRQPQGTS